MVPIMNRRTSIRHAGLWFAAVLGLVLAGEAAAAIFCGNNLVRQGDPIYRVANRCPEPFWVERRQAARFLGEHGDQPVYGSDTIESWYLNFGPRRMMRRLVFVNGRLDRQETLGYGVAYTPGSRRCDRRDFEHAGDTAGEIYARCGEPDYQYDFSTRIGPYYGGPWPIPEGVEREIWAYDLGRGRMIRELFFVDGRLIHIRTERR